MSFANLKRNRDNIQKLIKAAESTGGGGEKKSYADDRMWKPTVDQAGNGYAIIRFLPAQEGAELPWARYWDHGFKGPNGQWYIEKSLTSIGQTDPVGELNSRLWNTGIEEDKEAARRQKRRLHYVSNIYIVSDPSNPETEGKVFMYQYGKKIHDKIMDMMQPEFADEEPTNPFDMWEGADFKLKIRNVEGYRNYDKSEFSRSGPLLGGDDTVLEGVYNKMFDLGEWSDPTNYKTYDELKTKLSAILGETAGMGAATMSQASMMNEPAAAPAPQRIEPVAAENIKVEDDDDTLSYFAKLAEAD